MTTESHDVIDFCGSVSFLFRLFHIIIILLKLFFVIIFCKFSFFFVHNVLFSVFFAYSIFHNFRQKLSYSLFISDFFFVFFHLKHIIRAWEKNGHQVVKMYQVSH